MTRALRILLAAWLALNVVDPAFATPAQDLILFGTPHLPGSVIDLNFATGRYYTAGATGPLTVSRASPETCLDAAGNLYQVGNNLPCIAPGVGVGSWEARTESVPNNTMTGAAIGTSRTISGVTERRNRERGYDGGYEWDRHTLLRREPQAFDWQCKFSN